MLIRCVTPKCFISTAPESSCCEATSAYKELSDTALERIMNSFRVASSGRTGSPRVLDVLPPSAMKIHVRVGFFLRGSAELPDVPMPRAVAIYLGRLRDCTRDRNHIACLWPRGAVKGAEACPHRPLKDRMPLPGGVRVWASSHGTGSRFTTRWLLTGEARD